MAQSQLVASERARHLSGVDALAAVANTEALIMEASIALRDLSASAEMRIERAQAALLKLLPTQCLFNEEASLPRPNGPCGLQNAVLAERALAYRRRLGGASYTVSAENQPSLSSRQLMVLKLIGRGLSNKMIARELDITPETVKTHAKNILVRLKAQTRAEAIARATGVTL